MSIKSEMGLDWLEACGSEVSSEAGTESGVGCTRREEDGGASLVRVRRMLTRGDRGEVLRADPDLFPLPLTRTHAVAAWDERHRV